MDTIDTILSAFLQMGETRLRSLRTDDKDGLSDESKGVTYGSALSKA